MRNASRRSKVSMRRTSLKALRSSFSGVPATILPSFARIWPTAFGALQHFRQELSTKLGSHVTMQPGGQRRRFGSGPLRCLKCLKGPTKFTPKKVIGLLSGRLTSFDDTQLEAPTGNRGAGAASFEVMTQHACEVRGIPGLPCDRPNRLDVNHPEPLFGSFWRNFKTSFPISAVTFCWLGRWSLI